MTPEPLSTPDPRPAIRRHGDGDVGKLRIRTAWATMFSACGNTDTSGGLPISQAERPVPGCGRHRQDGGTRQLPARKAHPAVVAGVFLNLYFPYEGVLAAPSSALIINASSR
ncbi:hypothetical protein V5799_022931 [Amblyomma americanum]|uniref:Uncharacterized protein n=1 Tax=Amblyomma americanum TaxID=6943 RepID=A0AAQ4FKK6_AMBAM